MRKLLLFSLCVVVGIFSFSNVFADTCDPNDYCTYVQFKNINPEIAVLSVTASFEDYVNDQLKFIVPSQIYTINKNGGLIDTSDPKGWRFDWGGDFVHDVSNETPSRETYKNVNFEIDSVNGFKLNNCKIHRDLINAPGSNTFIITKDDESGTYSCQVQ